MKIKIAILEDETLAAKDLKCKLSEWSTHRNFEIELSEYCSGEDFWIQNTGVDLNSYAAFFLDIQMNKISGLEVAQKLRKDGYLNHIIFLTSFREYVFHGYEVHAMNYLLKPVKIEPLFRCLDEIAAFLSADSYFCKTKQELVRIPYKNILTFSSNLHYVDILTLSDHFCQYTTLNGIASSLPQEFIRIHRSCIVNMAHIYKISGSKMILSNHMTAQIGRTYSKDVIAAFARYSTRFDEKRSF